MHMFKGYFETFVLFCFFVRKLVPFFLSVYALGLQIPSKKVLNPLKTPQLRTFLVLVFGALGMGPFFFFRSWCFAPKQPPSLAARGKIHLFDAPFTGLVESQQTVAGEEAALLRTLLVPWDSKNHYF